MKLSISRRSRDPRILFRRLVSSVCRTGEFLAVKARYSQGRGPFPVRMLLLSDGLSAQNEAQFDPLLRNRRELGMSLGLIIQHAHLDPIRLPSRRQLAAHDLIAFKLNYKTAPETVVNLAAHLKTVKLSSSALIYCDGNDEVTIQWPDLLRHCDVYWKKHALRDRSGYLRPCRGGTNLTDYSLGDEASIPEWQSPADETQLHKIVCGSSIGLDQKIAALAPWLENTACLSQQLERKYDVVLRADVPDNWMGRLRRPAVDALRSLDGRLKILLPQSRVSQDQYAKEMMESRICVSPFGYGEICWRDFEAVAYGCLLFKPSMDHVESRPDIFQPFETYVPLAWDFSDLGEKLDYYLARPDESARMVARARQVMRECLQPEWYVSIVREMLSRLASDHSVAGIPRA